jgi:hypothetical protein
MGNLSREEEKERLFKNERRMDKLIGNRHSLRRRESTISKARLSS